jgi:hypothetical protein
MEAMTKHRSHSAAFKRQVAEEFIAGDAHGTLKVAPVDPGDDQDAASAHARLIRTDRLLREPGVRQRVFA